MSDGWMITCGKCGERSSVSLWMASDNVLLKACDFKCPVCGVEIIRVLQDVKIIKDHRGDALFAHGRCEIVEVGNGI